MDAEKALEKGAWQKLVLYVVPGAVVVVSFTLALGMQQWVSQREEGRWLAAAVFIVAIIAMGSFLEEVAGRFEAKCVDGFLYPCMRSVGKWWRTMDKLPKNRPNREVYISALCAVWERYLDLPARPAKESIRWGYYGNLVIRYRASIAMGLASAISSLVWLSTALYFYASAASSSGALDLGKMVAVGGSLFVLAAYLLLIEVPSSCAILHWHRIRLVDRYGNEQ